MAAAGLVILSSSKGNLVNQRLSTTTGANFIAADAGPGLGVVQPAADTSSLVATGTQLQVAFVADSGNVSTFRAVLNLIKAEQADLVLHQGDFDYVYDADGFFAVIDSTLGTDFPYLASVGNDDSGSWQTGCSGCDGCYAQFLLDRMARIGLTPDHPNLNDQMYSVTFEGPRIVFVGQSVGLGDSTYAPYLQSQLEGSDSI